MKFILRWKSACHVLFFTLRSPTWVSGSATIEFVSTYRGTSTISLSFSNLAIIMTSTPLTGMHLNLWSVINAPMLSPLTEIRIPTVFLVQNSMAKNSAKSSPKVD